MNFLRKRKFKVDITVIFCLLIIPTVIIIAGFTYYKTVDTTMKVANSLIDKVTDAVIEKTKNHLKPAQVLTQIAAKTLKKPNQKIKFDSDLDDLCLQVLELQPQVDLFYYGSENGSFIEAYSLSDGDPISSKWIDRSVEPPVVRYRHRNVKGEVIEETFSTDVKYDPRVRPWYIGAKTTKDIFWTDLYIFHENGKPGITVSSPISSESDDFLGVIAADITLDGLSTFLRNLNVSDNGVVFIIDGNNRFVAHPEPDQMVEIIDGKIQPLKATELNQKWISDAIRLYEDSGDNKLTYARNGEKYFARLTPFPDNFGKDWTIAVIIPENDFLGVIKETSITIVLISLVILIVAVLFGLLFARNLSKPIEQITNELCLVRDFDLNNREGVSSYVNEIQSMADAVDSMKNGLNAFKRYVPSDLVRQLIASGNEAKPGGKETEVTLFFSDIANFTSISEKLPAKELMVSLSEYFDTVAPAIVEESGTIDKFIGDAVMAFWGAPLVNDEHAVCACRSALKCRDAIKELNVKRVGDGDPEFKTRIGIHSGFAIVGNVGSSERLNYTALGDNVNLASRLEGVNKRYGTDIIVSQDTYRYARKKFVMRPLDLVAVKGKSNGVMIYELMSEVGCDLESASKRIADSFEQIFKLYLARDWSKALSLLHKLHAEYPDDQPTKIYIVRCKELIEKPPGDDWSGVIRLNRGDFQLI